MKSVNATCAKEGYPILVQHSAALGNHAIAARNIIPGERILKALPYAAEAFDSYRKRMCHVCLLYHTRSTFKHRCQDCDQVYYCSEMCKAIGMDPASGCHPKVCRALRRLATWDSDRHTKSIIKLYLQVLLSHWRERQGLMTPYQRHREMLREKVDREKEEEQLKTTAAKDSRSSDEPEKEETDLSLSSQMETQLCISSALPLSEQDTTTTSPTQTILLKLQEQTPIENSFEDVQALQSHVEDWDEEEHQDWNKQAQVVLSLLEMAGLTEMVADARTQHVRSITADDVKHTVSALESNCFGMFDRSRKKHVCFGRAIFPIASFFNHSCECNATAVQADGSEDVTGDDVLGAIAYEETTKANAGVKLTTTTTSSSPDKPNPSEMAAQTPSAAARMDGTVTPSTEPEEKESSSEEEAATKDPFELMTGEFRTISFFAMVDIPQGKDVTISYIDSDMPLQARRIALMSDYHFHCCCERCLREEAAQKATKAKHSKSSKKVAATKAAKKNKKK